MLSSTHQQQWKWMAEMIQRNRGQFPYPSALLSVPDLVPKVVLKEPTHTGLVSESRRKDHIHFCPSTDAPPTYSTRGKNVHVLCEDNISTVKDDDRILWRTAFIIISSSKKIDKAGPCPWRRDH